jgi:hypothetical protein
LWVYKWIINNHRIKIYIFWKIKMLGWAATLPDPKGVPPLIIPLIYMRKKRLICNFILSISLLMLVNNKIWILSWLNDKINRDTLTFSFVLSWVVHMYITPYFYFFSQTLYLWKISSIDMNFFLSSSLKWLEIPVDKWDDRGSNSGPLHNIYKAIVQPIELNSRDKYKLFLSS